MVDINLINITLNGIAVKVEKGSTILTVCKINGIDIPTFCFDERLKSHSACRICIVEVNGQDTLLPSCSTLVAEGMNIQTHNERVINSRRDILELLWANHPNDCLVCEKSGECDLQKYSYEYDIDPDSYYSFDTKKSHKINYSNKFYINDQNKCILCGKCIRVCDELQNVNTIGFLERGQDSYVGYPLDGSYENSVCVSCGNCVSICPVGALMPKSRDKFRNWDVKKVQTTCSYCGVGCQMDLVINNDKVVRIDPVDNGPNEGLLCVKGKFAYNYINHKDRLTKPLIKKDGEFQEATWDEVLNTIVNKITQLKSKYSSDVFAGLSSAKCTNEENYLMQKFMRAVLGTNNIDHCARLCHASTVAGLASTLGSGAMTNSISEVKNSDVIFILGSNTTETHPVIGSMILQAKRDGARIIVADPREIEMAKHADVYLQIEPGSNIALVNAMCHVIYKEKLYKESYIETRTENFEEFIEILDAYTPEIVSHICGVDAEDIIKAARIYAKTDKAAIYYSMGVTQHSSGTNNVKSLANLAMMCGNIGIESGGINPLRGQNNVQGACDLGALPNNYPGYQKVFDEKVQKKFEKAWGVPLSDKVGLTVTSMLEKAVTGEIKFLYIMGENPAVSDPNTNHVLKALKSLDFLVVQDIFLSETAKYADIVLPAVSFAEKDGTFTNTERKIQRIRKAIPSIGESKADWEIISDLMNRLGYSTDYNSPSDIMDEIALLTPIYGGINFNRIEEEGIQWPCPNINHKGTKFLHKDTFTRGLGLFTPTQHFGAMETIDVEYPLILTTGRSLYHFHTSTMTKRTKEINEIVGSNYLELSNKTAYKHNIKNGDLLRVTSRRGSSEARAKVIDRIKDGVVFMTFHYPGGANMLTSNKHLDKESSIPELKVSAVKIELISGS
ncbi:MAG: formate dehydrogenase subunit alpha [Spirochaetaceae bacterium]